jgi:hypothetical protein
MDIRNICPCVAGGSCTDRGVGVAHKVLLVWAEGANQRDSSTLATPAQLDEWMSSGAIVDAICDATCGSEVAMCPAFRQYLQHPTWEHIPSGRSAMRDFVKYVFATSGTAHAAVDQILREIENVLNAHGTTGSDRSRRDHRVFDAVIAAVGLCVMWFDGEIGLEALNYWRAVLTRYPIA